MSDVPIKDYAIDECAIVPGIGAELQVHEPKPFEERFFDFFNSIYGRIESFEGKGTANAAIKVCKKRAEAYNTTEEREGFYERLTVAFQAFFGVKAKGKPEEAEEIRELLGQAYPNVTEEMPELSDITHVEVLSVVIRNKLARLIRENANDAFDVHTFLNTLFDGAHSLTKNDFSQRIEEMKDNMPVGAYSAVTQFLTHSKSEVVQKKAIQQSLKKAVRRTVSTEEHGGVTTELAMAAKFLESLKKRRNITDIHMLSFLEASGVTFEQVISLLPEEGSLEHYVARSLYNGKAVKDAKFYTTLRSEIESGSMLYGSYEQDLYEIVELLCDLADGKCRPEDICIRVGIGGTEDPIPLRVVSYIVPVMNVVSRFFDTYGSAPSAELFTGQEGAIACNKFNPTIVRKTTSRIFSIMEDFVAMFYPKVAESFKVVEDIPWDANSEVRSVVEFLEERLRELATDDHELSRIMSELIRRGERRGGTEGNSNAFKYAAFHVICFNDLPDLNEHISPDRPKFGRVISFGGNAEKEFVYVRRKLTNDILNRGGFAKAYTEFLANRGQTEIRRPNTEANYERTTRASMITNTGVVPLYYFANDGNDIALDSLKGLDVDDIVSTVGRRIFEALGATENVPHVRSFLNCMGILASRISPAELAAFIHKVK